MIESNEGDEGEVGKKYDRSRELDLSPLVVYSTAKWGLGTLPKDPRVQLHLASTTHPYLARFVILA